MKNADLIIKQLKQMDVDGETMQYILRKVGMEHQMCHQLMSTMPMAFINAELSERIEMDRSLNRFKK